MSSKAQRFSQQPRYAVGINYNNPLTAGLKVAGYGPHSSESFRRPVPTGTWLGTSGTVRATPYGLGLGFTSVSDGGSRRYLLNGNYSPPVLGEATLFFATLGTGSNGPGGILGCGDTQNSSCISFGWQGTRLITVAPCSDGNFFRTSFSGGVHQANVLQVCAARINSITSTTFCRNGVLFVTDGNQGTGTVYAPAFNTPAEVGRSRIGNAALSAMDTSGTILAWGIWHRALSDREMVSLTTSPWQIFGNPQRRRFVSPSPSTEGYIKVWDGSAWIAKPVKVWNGTSWIQKPVKRWNGSSWV